jgi:hypothetical protein
LLLDTLKLIEPHRLRSYLENRFPPDNCDNCDNDHNPEFFILLVARVDQYVFNDYNNLKIKLHNLERNERFFSCSARDDTQGLARFDNPRNIMIMMRQIAKLWIFKSNEGPHYRHGIL